MIRRVPDNPLKAPVDLTDVLQNATGVIELGAGEYSIPQPLQLGARGYTEIRGESVGTTRIHAQNGAFNVRGRSKIKDLTIWRADWKNTDGTPKHDLDADGLPIPVIGLFVEGCVSMADVDIDNFTIGIYEWASKSGRGTNANGCRYRDVTIRSSGLKAMYLRGRDANAALVEGVRAYSSGEHASFWARRDTKLIEIDYAKQRAAGVAEKDLVLPANILGQPTHLDVSDFFGGTYIATLLASAHEDVWIDEAQPDGTTKHVLKRVEHPPVICDNDSNHSVFVGGYQESDQDASILAFPAVAIGGLATWKGPAVGAAGLRIDGATLSTFITANKSDPKCPVEIRVGAIAGQRTAFSLASPVIDNGRALSVEVLPEVLHPRTNELVQASRWILQIGNQKIPIWIENGVVTIAQK